jgi:hypothetical protein
MSNLIIIGVGKYGQRAVEDMIEEGVVADYLLIQEEKHAPTHLPTFQLLTDNEDATKLHSWPESEINFETDAYLTVVTIVDLGAPVVQTINSLSSFFEKQSLSYSVVGIVPQSTDPSHQIAKTNAESIICNSYMEFSLDEISQELGSQSYTIIWRRVLDYVVNSVELLSNGMNNGFRSLSDPSVEVSLLGSMFSLKRAHGEIYTGRGKEPSEAFQQAIDGRDILESKTVILSVTGRENASIEVVGLVKKTFTGELWLTENVIQSEMVSVIVMAV